ncbi:hypothetical protein [Psychroserpens damuponensis]|uniref:hypothetical protein n=1 Tax=Psychroserpens damuponensis TaxID=943936 RepID=UPI000590F6CA|nr:hypothetical protein [Psychroserpens damuponensis]
MTSAYNVSVTNCDIQDFNEVIKAYQGSFGDTIPFENTTVKNCSNGIVLAANLRGDYNAEMVTINNCEFSNVQSNVIHFFRDGCDESTISDVLTITNSTFTDCGEDEKSDILIKTRGIINAYIENTTFKYNPVEFIVIL